MKKLIAILCIFMLALGLVACSQPTDTANGTKGGSEVAEAITIAGVLGDVELEGPAQRVVALEWTYAENLLAVGVQPIGVTDIQNYNNWVQIEEKFDDNVVDVGTRQEPSLEKIAELQPDLIIAIKFRHEAIKSQLESIAPTVFFDPYPTDENFNQYDEMESTFREIAKAVGKSSEAEQVLAELEDTYVEAKAAIDSASLTTKDVILTQAFSANQAPQIRLFTPNALASVILEKIGLNNVHTSEVLEIYGFSTVNVEALTIYEEANYLYVVQDNDNIYENQLKDNKVWNGLEFVKENRTFPLGGDAWLFGGPLSAKVVVDRIVNILVTN
ncbi:ABC transporter substrate-binding protein [Serpentinicella alkaliphila]|uniref:Iron complex transport system substrate-binding protein n=1 Tax=Serpentinicella alkaliphila TaxID=1734049 RepID=A0A4R2T4K8_9FIRM|nr:iron-siderophore ABC transporter substrate-binding protein [Serpentinicella alkaliphila]QUH24499.1 iron-siderophore ABC transporter substrate-binding protein [Serpentinicella alkaliphila]TCP96955.1 iron complex transport system substrate-binding protein [Serpentinicella alkaliphila]